MRQLLRRSLFLRKIRFAPYIVLYWIACATVRIRPDRFLFLSDMHLGFTGNFAFLEAELRRQRPEAEIIGLFKRSFSARRSLGDAIRLPFLVASSRVIVLDDTFPIIYSFRIREGARLIQVWHAAGAFKQVGHSRIGLPGGPPAGSDMHKNYTAAPVASEGCRADYAEAFGLDISRVPALGVPRTDAFFDADAVAETRRQVRKRLGVADDERLVLCAPTFRGAGPVTARGTGASVWRDLAAELGPGFRVAVRQHPFVTRQSGELPPELIDASGGDMNELLMGVDVLVTDYSSSIFEYALMRRPYVLYVPDLDEYQDERAFYRPFDFYAAGAVVTEPERLADAVREGRLDRVRLEAMLDEICGALDGHSTERIVRELFL